MSLTGDGVYPRAMGSGSAKRPPPDRAEREAPTGAADAAPLGNGLAGEGEHTGPVAIRRLRKDDGRALILYSHDEREQR
jgi:hypothetical protein